MSYRVELAPAAQRDLRRLPRDVQVRLSEPLLALSNDPKPRGVRKIHGRTMTWRIRVGPYRVIYDVHDDRRLIVVLRVDRRRETTYRLS